jgi:hypothetical protein
VGVLTETAMRLRDEIVASRHARVALRGDLVRQTDERRTRVSALCAGFARDRADALRAWCGPTLAERQTAERQKRRRLAEEATAKAQEKQRRLAEEATAKAQEKQRRLAEEATAKAQAEKQRGLAEEATAKAQEKQRRLAEEATAKAQEKQPPAPPKAEPQRHQAAKAFTAPHARPPVAPLPPARKPPFRGSKKH